MRLVFALLLLLTAFGGRAASDPKPLKVRVSDLPTLRQRPAHVELVGRITAAVRNQFLFEDDSGATLASDESLVPVWSVGDRVRLDAGYSHNIGLFVLNAEILGKDGGQRTPDAMPIGSVVSGAADNRFVTVSGTVTDAFLDELDPNYIFLTLEADGHSLILTDRNIVDQQQEALRFARTLIDREVSVSGICDPARGSRSFLRRSLRIDLNDSAAIRPAGKTAGIRFPHRLNLQGDVLAFYDRQTVYLKMKNGDRVRVRFLSGTTPPSVGSRIAVAGFPRRNTFFPAYYNATFRRLDGAAESETPADVTPDDVLNDAVGRHKINVSFEGRPIRLTGTVQSVSSQDPQESSLTLLCRDIPVSVRLGDLPAPAAGSLIAVTGICSLTAEADATAEGFPRLTGFTVLTRTADDLTVLRNPPWWTRGRMLVVILLLLGACVGALVWSRSLHRLADKRGREIASARLTQLRADLRVNERTRIAVDLHDALSQSLTGVSLQLDAVRRFADGDRSRFARHLDLATSTLKSCRNELRNCLWDLRNRALEATDMNEAIRLTASPFIGDAELIVRFNVPRDRLSDDTAHALMRIVRELATNAVRHGKARTIRIAGTVDGDTLAFSVRDDGCGFDTSAVPGIADGHFGLSGIRERIQQLGGEMRIDSKPGAGTDVTLSIKT